MRFNEFKTVPNPNILLEYDPNISDEQLKDLIVNILFMFRTYAKKTLPSLVYLP